MKIEVELTLIESYEVRIKGKLLGVFKKESSWEGMSKLRRDDGNGAVIVDDPMPARAAGVVNHKSPLAPTKHNVISISPSLIPTEVGIDRKVGLGTEPPLGLLTVTGYLTEADYNHLLFIYGRMVNVHGEKISVDYMWKFKEILKILKPKQTAIDLRTSENV